jgi:DNA-directed RNA polymerase subunit K/omega
MGPVKKRKGASMPEMLEYELEKLEQRGISRYKAVLMAAQEARFINDQLRLGILKSKIKPTSMALQKLFDGRIVESEESPIEG